MGLITLNDIDIYLQTTRANPSIDTPAEELYEFLIEAVSDQLEVGCNRTFAETTYTERLDGPGATDLLLKQLPIISLTSVNYIDIDENLTEINTDNIYIDRENGWLHYSYGFGVGRYNLQIKYVAGFSVIPNALKLKVCKFVVDE